MMSSPATATLFGALLVVAACFNPTGQVDPTATDGTTTTATATTDASTTIGESTTDATTTTTTTDATTTDATTTTTDATTTDASSTTSQGGCEGEPDPDAACAAIDAEHPFCDLVDGTCVECLVKDDCGSNGVCEVDSQTCVECVEDGDCGSESAPACDLGTLTCGCSEHSDCPDTACEIDAALCFPTATTTIVYSRASTDASCDQTDQICDAEQPCCSIEAALDFGLAQGQTHLVVRVIPSTDKERNVVFTAAAVGKRIAILGTDGVGKIESIVGGGPVVYVNQAAKVYLSRLALSVAGTSLAGAGVSCYGGTGVWADDVSIGGLANGIGFFAGGCPMSVRRGVVLQSLAGAWASAGATMKLVNSIIAEPANYAVKASMGGTLDIVFSTITERSGQPGHLVQCADPGTQVNARNSILVTTPEDNSSACAAISVVDSVVTDATLKADDTVTLIADGEVPGLFLGWLGNNLHIKPSASVLDGRAIRAAGDPVTDFDRDPRPLPLGAVDWAGADRP